MKELKCIKPSPLKDKFKKYGDTFEMVSKNESNRMYCYRRTTLEGFVYFEVFRSNLYKDENGHTYEYAPEIPNSAYPPGAFVIANTHKRRFRSICKEVLSK